MIRLLLFLILLVATFSVFAVSTTIDDEQLHFRRLSAVDGLPSVYINTILQRHDGLMWIGTKGGLSKFDGQNMFNYHYHANNTNSLGSDDVLSLYEDHQHQLWVGTSKGLYLFNDASDEFSAITFGHIHPSPLIFTITQDAQNNYWVGTNKGVFVFDSQRTLIWQGLTDKAIKFIGQSSTDKVWLGTKQGLWLINPLDFSFTSLSTNNAIALDVAELQIYDGLIDNTLLWLATKEGVIKIDTTKLTIIAQLSSEQGALSSNNIWSIAKHGDDLWLGYFYDGISRFNTQTGKSTHSVYHPQINDTISHNNVSKVYFDRTGLLWVATTNGLSVTNPKNSVIRQLGEYQNVTNKHVWSVARHNEKIWFGSEDGLNKFDLNTNKLTTFPSSQQQGQLPRTIIWSVVPEQNNVWLGTNQGLMQFVTADSQSNLFENKALTENNIANQSIYTLKHFNNELLIGYYNGAIAKFNLASQEFSDTILHVSEGYITNLIHDQDHLLVASQYGLYRVKNGLTEQILPNSRLANSHITALRLLDNQLWVATLSDGLFVLNRQDQQWQVSKHLTVDSGLPENTVKSISSDLQGNIWAVGRNAVYKIAQHGFKVTLFTSQFYWLNMEFHDNATITTPDNLQIFAGNEGLVLFPAKIINRQTRFPKLILSSVQIMNKKFNNVGSDHHIIIKPDEHFYSFNVSALEYLSPESIKYQYKLTPGQTVWQPLNSSKITLSNLPYGQYQLHIRATNSDRVFNDHELAINLNVVPPIWWTPVAKVLYLLAILILVIKFILFHKGRLKRMTYKARHDALTGLPNRDYLLNQLKKKMLHAINEQQTIAILFFDLNEFKMINDKYGHDVGDNLLKHVAQQVNKCIREKDFFARQSGDEFILLLDNIHQPSDISNTIKRIKSAFQETFVHNNTVINFDSSIGISLFEGDKKVSAEELIKQADRAMYQCKKHNTSYHYFTAEQ
ncbi:diguanylate cyclase domain-containing protein [Pseudoalteromonas mariniglutinosa]|uniref:ligand-binding sensor domain-containing protein n=1 Tax=Pseudoalteromonas mariniglutinosa TaxID=206042 RepID=UPI0038507BC4